MTLSKVNPFTKKPTDLPDSPSPLFSAQEIKEHFQAPADELLTGHNNLVESLEAPTGASEIGAKDGVTNTNVQALLDTLKGIKAEKTEIQTLQNQVDSLVVDGDSSPAIAQALAGSEFTTLKQKLDSTDSQLAENAKRLNHHQTILVSHKGLGNVYPENTLLAMEMACLAGYKVISTDILPTSDSVLVVHHDTTVDRMTNGTGSVQNFSLAQIKALQIDGGSNVAEYPNLKVPTLEETLILLRKYNVRPMLELKVINDYSQLDDLISLLKKYGFEYNSTIESSVTYLIDEFRKRGGKSECVLLDSVTANNNALLQSYGNCGYDLNYTAVTQAIIDDIHSNGLTVSVYTVNDTTVARNLKNWGADYIISDTIREVS